MIKVKISYEGNDFKCLEVKGHAGSGPKGHDLVCAAVSSTITGGFNALEDVSNFEIKLDEGYALLRALKKVPSHDAIVIQTIICGLQTIEENYGDFIQIKAE